MPKNSRICSTTISKPVVVDDTPVYNQTHWYGRNSAVQEFSFCDIEDKGLQRFRESDCLLGSQDQTSGAKLKVDLVLVIRRFGEDVGAVVHNGDHHTADAEVGDLSDSASSVNKGDRGRELDKSRRNFFHVLKYVQQPRPLSSFGNVRALFCGVSSSSRNRYGVRQQARLLFCMTGLFLHQFSLTFDCRQGGPAWRHAEASFVRLNSNFSECGNSYTDTRQTNERKAQVDPNGSFVVTIFAGGRNNPCLGISIITGLVCDLLATVLLCENRKSRWGWACAFLCIVCFTRLGVSLHREDVENQNEYMKHNEENVSQKQLTPLGLRITVIA